MLESSRSGRSWSPSARCFSFSFWDDSYLASQWRCPPFPSASTSQSFQLRPRGECWSASTNWLSPSEFSWHSWLITLWPTSPEAGESCSAWALESRWFKYGKENQIKIEWLVLQHIYFYLLSGIGNAVPSQDSSIPDDKEARRSSRVYPEKAKNHKQCQADDGGHKVVFNRAGGLWRLEVLQSLHCWKQHERENADRSRSGFGSTTHWAT